MATGNHSISTHALVVDMDDTLIRTDVLYEQVLKLLKTKPLLTLMLPLWLLRGICYLKSKLALFAPVDPSRLPYREKVLHAIDAARNEGKKVILASASHVQVVRRVSDHLGVFDQVIATEGVVNLKGEAKLNLIQSRLNGASFTYFGDSKSDLTIWRSSHGAVAVNPSPSVTKKLGALGVPYQIVRDQPSMLKLVLKQMRVFQWVKNALLFVPLLAGHRFFDLELWRRSALAALSFSLIASAVYVMNDLLDVEADRAHHSKRNRPFASGNLPIRWGFFLLPALILSGSITALSLGVNVLGWIAGYFALNIVYSWKLKEVLVIDTVILAGFYTMRILTGSAATGIATSTWLLAFSIFFFFGLAMVKRYTELLHSRGNHSIHGRGYVYNDKLPVFVIGIASSFLAIVILVLYLNSQDVQKLYSHPENLWLITPVLLYWTSRLWLLANRDEVHEDPVLFSIKDAVGWVVLAVSGAILYSAI